MNIGKLRTRTLMMTIMVGLVALALAISVFVLRQVLINEDGVVTDRSLRTQGQELARALSDASNEGEDDWIEQVVVDYFATEVTSPSKTILVMSDRGIETAVGQSLVDVSPTLEQLASAAQRDEVALVDGISGTRSLRILARVVDDAVGLSDGTLIIALDRQDRQEVIDQASQDAAIVAVATLLLVLPLAWWLAGVFVRPIELLANTAQDITVHELDQRLPSQGTAEVAHLIESFNAMIDRLQVAVSEQRRFLNDASHELRTPLTVMRGHLEMARGDETKSLDATNVALTELDRMGRIVDDLLVLARANQVGFLRIGPFDSDDFVESIVTRVSAMSDHRWVIDALPLGVVNADVQRLDQIMLNLCVNAARHTAPGAEIGIGAELGTDWLHMWVRDTGEGIDASDHALVFERFRRGSTQRSPGGSAGLGLSIARAIAEAHGGSVTLESELGEGATFHVLIPVTHESEIQFEESS